MAFCFFVVLFFLCPVGSFCMFSFYLDTTCPLGYFVLFLNTWMFCMSFWVLGGRLLSSSCRSCCFCCPVGSFYPIFWLPLLQSVPLDLLMSLILTSNLLYLFVAPFVDVTLVWLSVWIFSCYFCYLWFVLKDLLGLFVLDKTWVSPICHYADHQRGKRLDA